MSLLAGIGFTVSLLISELSFAPDSVEADYAKVAALSASLLAALLATAVLMPRNRRYRDIEAQAALDSDSDGIPDIYEQGGKSEKP